MSGEYEKKNVSIIPVFCTHKLVGHLLSSFMEELEKDGDFFFFFFLLLLLEHSYYVELKTSSRFSFLIKTYKGDFSQYEKSFFFSYILLSPQPCFLIISIKRRFFFSFSLYAIKIFRFFVHLYRVRYRNRNPCTVLWLFHL